MRTLNRWPSMDRRRDHDEVYVLPCGDFYILSWGPHTSWGTLLLCRKILTDCHAEFMGEL